ncbi:MAG: YtxH domain-containing protein [Deltaproteobacteria bacterium]|nr:YtxH domain-containing protein [Deltaproteobacteria bacterium]
MGVVIGGLLGFGYYQIVGCPTGGCTLTSSPEITTGYGMLLGAVASISA